MMRLRLRMVDFGECCLCFVFEDSFEWNFDLLNAAILCEFDIDGIGVRPVGWCSF